MCFRGEVGNEGGIHHYNGGVGKKFMRAHIVEVFVFLFSAFVVLIIVVRIVVLR